MDGEAFRNGGDALADEAQGLFLDARLAASRIVLVELHGCMPDQAPSSQSALFALKDCAASNSLVEALAPARLYLLDLALGDDALATSFSA